MDAINHVYSFRLSLALIGRGDPRTRPMAVRRYPPGKPGTFSNPAGAAKLVNLQRRWPKQSQQFRLTALPSKQAFERENLIVSSRAGLACNWFQMIKIA
jgi:hypothetical protein